MGQNKNYNNVYIGFAETPRIQQNVSFKLEQLDELKKYATNSGNINLTVVTTYKRYKKEANSFVSVDNPHANAQQPVQQTQSQSFQPTTSEGDLPF